MSTGGWELVGKNKKDKSNGKVNKLSKAEKKKFIESAPKVEDFLPLSQVKTLYNNLDSNKENKKPVKQKESKTKENEEKKKQQQKQQQQQQQAEKKKQEPKEKPPKSIKDALNAINTEELSNVLTTAQARFPDAPLIWLKDLAAYLNVKIPLDKEDAVFSGKPKDYPLSVVPKTVSSVLEKAVEMAGQQTAQLFYEITLTTMATDMVKGVPVVGHKIFLQLLAHSNPKMVVSNIPKLVSVKNSYQNRKPIGLSLLWAMSQAGRKNLAVGLKIWHEVMSPMLETKSYASYVAQILNEIVFGHENVTDLSPEVYLEIVEDTCSGKLNIPATVGREINNSIEKLRSILFKNKTINHTKLFEMLMTKITQKAHVNYRNELVKALVACLVADPTCFSTGLYAKNSYQLNLLLSYINTEWNSLPPQLKSKGVKQMCKAIQTPSETGKKGKDENFTHSCSKLSKEILGKMTASTEKKFPWKKGCFVLIALIAAAVAYDVQKHQSFASSNVGQFLKKSGLQSHGERAFAVSKEYTSKALAFVESTSPEYYKTAVDFCSPYVKLANDFYIVFRNLSIKAYHNAVAYAHAKGPVVVDTIEYYVPGMLEQITFHANQAVAVIKSYSALGAEKAVEYSRVAILWLEKNVFVGKLSPENLQSYASRAIDTTQSLASQTYDWVYEKVQTLSKVP